MSGPRGLRLAAALDWWALKGRLHGAGAGTLTPVGHQACFRGPEPPPRGKTQGRLYMDAHGLCRGSQLGRLEDG